MTFNGSQATRDSPSEETLTVLKVSPSLRPSVISTATLFAILEHSSASGATSVICFAIQELERPTLEVTFSCSRKNKSFY